MCVHSQHTYLYAVVALQQIEKSGAKNATVLERLRQELYQSVKSKCVSFGSV